MLDAIVLIFGLILFIIFKIVNWKHESFHEIVGKPILTKSHLGICQHITDKGYAHCLDSNSAVFYAKASRLFWSDGMQAFMERK